MSQPSAQEARIQQIANILSLLALIGGMDKAAVQRVLMALGPELVGAPGDSRIEPDLVARLLAEIARADGEQVALRITAGLSFVASAWQPVLDQYALTDPHRLLPTAEIIYALLNYSAYALFDHGAFRRFGGPDLVLPMQQMTAALKTYAVPRTDLVWELVGFEDPPDQALVASDPGTMYLFKAAPTHVILRFSELSRSSDEGPRREHDVAVDDALFAAFVAGLLGDMLYWAARLRAGAQPGQQTWRRLKAILHSASS